MRSTTPNGLGKWLLVVVLLTAMQLNGANDDSSDILNSIEDVHGKIVGVYDGTVHDLYVAENYPTSTIKRYDSVADLVLSLQTGKIDVAFMDLISARVLIKSNPDFGLLASDIFNLPLGVGFNKKNTALRMKFNQFLKTIKENGEFDEMYARWFESDPEKAVMPKVTYPKNGPLLRAGVDVADLPYVAYVNNEYVGFDIEMIQRFALSQGCRLEIQVINFASLIAALSAGKVDLITDGISITPERQQKIDFSDPYSEMMTGVLAKKSRLPVGARMGTPKDLVGRRVSILEGSVYDKFVTANYPEAKILRQNSISDMIIALKTNKTDFFLVNSIIGKVLLKENPELAVFIDNVLDQPMGVGFNKKHPELRDKFNAFLKKMRDTGEFDEVYNRWFVNDPEAAVMPEYPAKAGAPVLNLGFDILDLPFTGFRNNEYVGFDIELMRRFAHAEGYRLELTRTNFASLVAALAAGKVDLISSGITITAERQKQIDFADPYVKIQTVVLTRKALMNEINNTKETQVVESPGFFASLYTSFHDNIIHEKRYLLIVEGLRTTAVISLWSVLAGTVLGGLICFMRMSANPLLRGPAMFFISILRGMPILVILMITFYVIFASVNISPVLVSILAFGLTFAAYVSEMYRSGIEGVEKGQTEAGIAMGFNRLQTFVYIVAPQAMRRILPVYKGEVISLVKMTSIVGYIAVQDLTRAGDIIRSRTFDAFFPLIMVAVLYFMISWLLLVVLTAIENHVEPKRKTLRSH